MAPAAGKLPGQAQVQPVVNRHSRIEAVFVHDSVAKHMSMHDRLIRLG